MARQMTFKMYLGDSQSQNATRFPDSILLLPLSTVTALSLSRDKETPQGSTW